jgi:hypothetical protein
LTLTQAGLDRGLTLSTFATDFPSFAGVLGPLGMAFPDSGGVLVSDLPGNVRLFPGDADGQSASDVPPTQNYGLGDALDLATVNGDIYLARRASGAVAQVRDDGSFLRTVMSGLIPTGLAANQVNGHLLVSDQTGRAIVEVDPAAGTSTPFTSGFFDGLTVSADGRTLYAAAPDRVIGFDLSTHAPVWDSGPIAGTPDGVVEEAVASEPYLYVNCNNGTIVEVKVADRTQAVVATGGSRGDFARADPHDGSALFTQSDSIVRLRFPQVAVNDAAFVSQSVPGEMTAGQAYPVSVTMNNVGDTTWTADAGYRLGSQNPQDNTTWGFSRVELPGPVAPGQQVTFQFTVTAPADPGTYDFQWRMVQDAVEWFGDFTPDVPVQVTGGLGDPGFETPDVSGLPGGYQYNPAGSPWTFDGLSGVAANGSDLTGGNPDAPQGNQVAFLQGTGSISQAAAFAAGTYALSFFAAQRANFQDSFQVFQVLVDGQVVGTFGGPDMGTDYALYSTDGFTVAAGTHTVAFVGLDPNGGDNTAFLDLVQLNPVPGGTPGPSLGTPTERAPLLGSAGRSDSGPPSPRPAGSGLTEAPPPDTRGWAPLAPLPRAGAVRPPDRSPRARAARDAVFLSPTPSNPWEQQVWWDGFDLPPGQHRIRQPLRITPPGAQ